MRRNGLTQLEAFINIVDTPFTGAFFFLLQSEDDDLYKVAIEHEEEEVRSSRIKYFDTVPVASSLCILKSGFPFVASEFGNR
jgi:splicing factor 3B subunit 3